MSLRLASFLILALLPACSAATFQPVDWPRSGPPSEARTTGEWELGVMRNAHGVKPSPGGLAAPLRFATQVRDTWDSAILRWFTPLESNEAEFWALITVDPAEAELALDQPVRWRAEETGERIGGWDEVYVDSVHRYFALPLLYFDMYGSLPSQSTGGKAYRRLWAAFGDDEFVLWTDPETGRLAFAEFTFRGVSNGYTGILEYLEWSEFRSADGWDTRILPTTVLVRNDFDGEVVHQLDFVPIEDPREVISVLLEEEDLD